MGGASAQIPPAVAPPGPAGPLIAAPVGGLCGFEALLDARGSKPDPFPAGTR